MDTDDARPDDLDPAALRRLAVALCELLRDAALRTGAGYLTSLPPKPYPSEVAA
jgi:hypothetical protein